MATEIERKFLVADDSWNDGSPGVRMSQGYLAKDADRTVRVRLAGPNAWLTIKGRTVGISRPEYEYAIPPEDARELLAMCPDPAIDKTRHAVSFAGYLWEVDVFHGANAGLVVAEVEISDESGRPDLPPWLGAEVSEDRRYSNSRLAVRPFSQWGESEGR